MQCFFNQIDTDKSGALDLNEFIAAVSELRLEVTQEDIKRLFAIFDHNKDSVVDYQEFVHTMRGSLSAQRA